MSNELNKKLAEQEVDIQGLGNKLAEHFGIPYSNYPLSLDACFKWLVPKLVGKYYLNLIVDDLGGDARIYNKFKSTSGDLVALYQDKSPALALCLAIEKLIDGEKIG